MVELGNLNIVGVSSVNGGSYHKVKVLGELSVQQNMAAHRIKVAGSMKSENSVTCDSIGIMGTMKTNQLTVREKATVLGTLAAETITTEEMDVLGEVRCLKEMGCGDLEVRGAIEVEGLLNAENVRIKSSNVSRVKEMGGRKIKVSSAFPFSRRVLRAELMEFDDLDLECTEAAVVRGKNIVIGENCIIDVVEYSDNLIRHGNAQIGEVRKI